MNLLDGSPRLDHACRSCGQRRAHRCQSIILSATSDLKWPFSLLCGQTALITVQQLKWTRGGVIGASVHSDYSVESISNGDMKHRQWCPLILACICWISLLIRQLVWRSSLHRLRACEERGASLSSLNKIPLHPGPPAVATELPTHSNSAARDKPAPRARTCRTWVNKRIRAKPVNCCQ